MGYTIRLSKQALKDGKLLEQAKLDKKARILLEIIKNDPYRIPPAYEKLTKDLKGKLSRKINIQHRIVYEVFENEKIVKIYRMWSHYDV